MAKKKSLSCLGKRDLLNQSAVSVETLLQWGLYFEECGLVYDAVNFYEKAKDSEALIRLREDALKEGNVFLFKRLCHLTGYEPNREEWLQIAQKAEEAGKYAFAADAYRQGGQNEPENRQSMSGKKI